MAASIHPTAVVHGSAQFADGVRVGPFCVIGPEVTIGDGTELRSHVVVESHTRIGRENVIFQFATVGGTPQDRKYQGEVTWCEVGDRNHVRECVTIHRGTGNGGSLTRIGNDNLIMGGVHIAHDCRLGNHLTIANEAMLAGHVHVDDRAAIGGGAGLHHFLSVGRCAFIAGMASVERDVPPFMIAHGNPAIVRAPNTTGMQRWGYSPEVQRALQDVYRRLFGSRTERAGLPILDVVRQLREEFADLAEVLLVCDAVERSVDGVKGRALESARRDDKRQAISAVSGAASVRTQSES